MIKDKELLKIRQELGAKLKMFRENANMSQQQVADQIGVSQHTISKVEAGLWSFGIDVVIAYTRLLGCTVDFV